MNSSECILLVLSGVIGFFSSLLGIGGIIHVPVMVQLLHIPPHIATATSHFILAFTSGIGSLPSPGSPGPAGVACRASLKGRAELYPKA